MIAEASGLGAGSVQADRCSVTGQRHVAGTVPYAWPYDGCFNNDRLALVVAGAQRAWRERSPRAIPVGRAVQRVASAFRAVGATVVLVRHHAASGRTRTAGLPPSPGDPGWGLAVDAAAGDAIVDAGGIDGFYQSDLDGLLRSRGIGYLCLAGFAAELTVDSTVRSANDRGYECLLVTDAMASLDPGTGARVLHSVTMSGGIFGAVGAVEPLLSALGPATERGKEWP